MARETKTPDIKHGKAPAPAREPGHTPAPSAASSAEVADFVARVRALAPAKDGQKVNWCLFECCQ
jgi:hypothetical protein